MRVTKTACRILWPGLSYLQDGLATVHNCRFMADETFVRAYRAGKETGSWRERDIHWRVHVACWAAAHAAHLPGDWVECGVYRGGLALAVAEYTHLDRMDKTFYLVDSFGGLVAECISEEERRLGRRPGGYEDCSAEVAGTFARFPNVRVIKGIVPDILPSVGAQAISYLSLDMNCALPEVAAAEFFWDRMVTGGIIVLDDYAYRGFEPQGAAFDDFAAARGTSVLDLPTGQGIIVKP
jgi:O-methyltransferase